MIEHPAVVVHGLRDAESVLALGQPVTLLSAPGAALFGGCLWWRGVVSAACQRYPETPCEDILDCADAPGRAMAALRVGQRALILDPAAPAYDAVAAAAASLGAHVLPRRPASLDVAVRADRARLAAWLSRDTPATLG